MSTDPRRRLLVPDVVQTSQMDCGPAALEALAAGFSMELDSTRLREACQTSTSGTSIDAIEEVALGLGLDAVQTMVPVDYVGEPGSLTLPALAIVRLESGNHHMVVLWRRHGGHLQIMDPATGRRWPRLEALRGQLLSHTHQVDADDLCDYLRGAGAEPLCRRLESLGFARQRAIELQAAMGVRGWFSCSALDAAARLVRDFVAAGVLQRGARARTAVLRLVERANALGPERCTEAVPEEFWFALPAAPSATRERVTIRGAVLLRIAGCDPAAPLEAAPQPGAAAAPPGRAPLSKRRWAIASRVLQFSKALGFQWHALAALAAAAGAAAAFGQGLLLRAALEAAPRLASSVQRASGLAAVLAFLIIGAVLEGALSLINARIGRHVEVRFRQSFLEAVRRLPDGFFRARLTSDLAQRAHGLAIIRGFPVLGMTLLRSLVSLLLTAAGVLWLDIETWPWVLSLVALGIIAPLGVAPLLKERDMRLQTQQGAVTRSYLDAMLGLVPIRAHGAELTIRSEHEALVVDLVASARGVFSLRVLPSVLLAAAGIVTTALLFRGHIERSPDAGASMLLLVFWALQLPGHAGALAAGIAQYPSLVNALRRVLEPMDATPEYTHAPPVLEHPTAHGVSLAYRGVCVRVPGATLLDGVDLEIPAGSHVAIVGPSGAGKSTLVGLWLGWLRPAEGELRLEGRLATPEQLAALRQETAWIDSQTQLWNRSVLDNVRYGHHPAADGAEVARAVRSADLLEALARLPGGLQTEIGETGALLSGGEGQRVRFARAWMRSGARLAILDEPLRGVSRQRREAMIAEARRRFARATLLCVTHDVAATRAFPRVLVVEAGRVVEDGSPERLLSHPSRYASLVRADEALRTDLLEAASWRRVQVEAGGLHERA